MSKIALLGYGKMGKVIEQIALERGHTIVLKKNIDDSFDGLENADVAIEFSAPNAAVENISKCFELGVPVVAGTTGWLEKYDDMVKMCEDTNGAFIYGSNFSLGVNIFFELNKTLAKMMAQLEQYNVRMDETHHTQKLDAPSGTAITLAEGILENSPKYNKWTLEKPKADEINIEAFRVPEVPGTHSIYYESDIDTIEIRHTAHSRQGFALGSVVAAEWLLGKKGVYSMKDVLNLK
ncbi:MAG: 4-hydroxy-tetrahydrodipicolinate reductase [Flavobacteriales bacterium]|nr:4-hydroxy-tetrahydrodipicolinate reductase [Flavobacteriales bacterium]